MSGIWNPTVLVCVTSKSTWLPFRCVVCGVPSLTTSEFGASLRLTQRNFLKRRQLRDAFVHQVLWRQSAAMRRCTSFHRRQAEPRNWSHRQAKQVRSTVRVRTQQVEATCIKPYLEYFAPYSGFTQGTPVFTHYTSARRRYSPPRNGDSTVVTIVWKE